MGKSLVSQFVLRHRLDSDEQKRTLVIAPTVELRKQYARLGEWLRTQAGDSPGRFVAQLDRSRSPQRPISGTRSATDMF